MLVTLRPPKPSFQPVTLEITFGTQSDCQSFLGLLKCVQALSSTAMIIHAASEILSALPKGFGETE